MTLVLISFRISFEQRWVNIRACFQSWVYIDLSMSEEIPPWWIVSVTIKLVLTSHTLVSTILLLNIFIIYVLVLVMTSNSIHSILLNRRNIIKTTFNLTKQSAKTFHSLIWGNLYFVINCESVQTWNAAYAFITHRDDTSIYALVTGKPKCVGGYPYVVWYIHWKIK